MTQSELKQKLYSLVRVYFNGAEVGWGKVKAVNPNVPQIVLNMGAVSRHYHPVTQSVDGVLVNGYPSQTTLQVDLYTKGAATNTTPGMTATYENTAINDLTDFLNYINSAYGDDWGLLNDVSILCNQVTDLTELINDVSWDYRAMIEMEIGFTQSAVGHTGTMYENKVPYHDNGIPRYDAEGYTLDRDGNRLPIPPLPIGEDGKPIYPATEHTASGGRTAELAGQHTGWFEQVDGPDFE